MQVAVESFGFKHGLPLDADIVMDVRFLPNPHWDEELRPLTGHDPAVRDYVIERPQTAEFLDRFDDLLQSRPPGLPGRGAQLPHDRDRLHRRSPPLGRASPRSSPPGCAHRGRRRPHEPPRRHRDVSRR